MDYYTPESKRSSAEWTAAGENLSKRSKTQMSDGKLKSRLLYVDSITPFTSTREPLNIVGSFHLTSPLEPITGRKHHSAHRLETPAKIRGVGEQRAPPRDSGKEQSV
ncbi:hypothetical protein TNCV_2435281 [Trichonephila clavipes]|nr:hypothetical protein TNCV_2435281 [Trichonephila clavipes]